MCFVSMAAAIKAGLTALYHVPTIGPRLNVEQCRKSNLCHSYVEDRLEQVTNSFYITREKPFLRRITPQHRMWTLEPIVCVGQHSLDFSDEFSCLRIHWIRRWTGRGVTTHLAETITHRGTFFNIISPAIHLSTFLLSWNAPKKLPTRVQNTCCLTSTASYVPFRLYRRGSRAKIS